MAFGGSSSPGRGGGPFRSSPYSSSGNEQRSRLDSGEPPLPDSDEYSDLLGDNYESLGLKDDDFDFEMPSLLDDASFLDRGATPESEKYSREMNEYEDLGLNEEDFKHKMPSLKSAFFGKDSLRDEKRYQTSGSGKEALYEAYNQLHSLAQVRHVRIQIFQKLLVSLCSQPSRSSNIYLSLEF